MIVTKLSHFWWEEEGFFPSKLSVCQDLLARVHVGTLREVKKPALQLALPFHLKPLRVQEAEILTCLMMQESPSKKGLPQE